MTQNYSEEIRLVTYIETADTEENIVYTVKRKKNDKC